jgi:hypothetical protein
VHAHLTQCIPPNAITIYALCLPTPERAAAHTATAQPLCPASPPPSTAPPSVACSARGPPIRPCSSPPYMPLLYLDIPRSSPERAPEARIREEKKEGKKEGKKDQRSFRIWLLPSPLGCYIEPPLTSSLVHLFAAKSFAEPSCRRTRPRARAANVSLLRFEIFPLCESQPSSLVLLGLPTGKQ